MTELKPCPFCGGEARIKETDYEDSWKWCRYVIDCPACTDGYRGKSGDSYGWDIDVCGNNLDVLIEAWNTRWERTCRVEDQYEGFPDHHLMMIGRCSECGERIEIEHNFCFNCGAKVVEG